MLHGFRSQGKIMGFIILIFYREAAALVYHYGGYGIYAMGQGVSSLRFAYTFYQTSFLRKRIFFFAIGAEEAERGNICVSRLAAIIYCSFYN